MKNMGFMREHVAVRCRLAALVLLVCPSATALDLIAATSLEACNDRASSGGLTCAQKLVIAASIQNAEQTGTGSFEYLLGPDSPPLAGADGDAFTRHIVADSISIVVTQSPIRLTYPVTYLQDANNGMWEEVLSADRFGTALDAVINPCRDDPGASTAATCGWALQTDPSGAQSVVPNSQGFCCSCSADLTTLTLTNLPRSGKTCTFFNRPAAASCPRLSRLWYSVYAIGEASMDFDIHLYVYRCRPTDAALAAWTNASGTASAFAAPRCRVSEPGCVCALLASDSVNSRLGLPPLGPTLPTNCYPLPGRPTSSCDILFRLVGTFAAPSATVSFASKLLLVPTFCDVTTGSISAADAALCAQRLSVDGPDKFLVVDRMQVSLDGTECDKVGVGFTAFRSQGNACKMPAGTCLSRQPGQLYAADVARVAAGQRPLHFLSSFHATTSDTEALGTAAPANGVTASNIQQFPQTPWQLRWSTQRFQSSLFVIEVSASADSLRVITAVSAGRIVSVAAPTFDAGSMGVLSARVANIGSIAARYTLSLGCPAQSLLPIPAVPLALAAPVNGSNPLVPAVPPLPPSEAVATFQLSVTSGGQSLAGSGFGADGSLSGCVLVLMDAQGVVTDRANVTITVTEIDHSYGGQGGGQTGETAAGPPANSTGGTAACGVRCEKWFDLECAARAGIACTTRLLQLGGGLAGGLLLAAVLAKLALTFGLCPHAGTIYRVLCCCCNRGGSSASKRAPTQEEEEEEEEARARAARKARRARQRTAADAESESTDEADEDTEPQVHEEAVVVKVGQGRPHSAVDLGSSTLSATLAAALLAILSEHPGGSARPAAWASSSLPAAASDPTEPRLVHNPLGAPPPGRTAPIGRTARASQVVRVPVVRDEAGDPEDGGASSEEEARQHTAAGALAKGPVRAAAHHCDTCGGRRAGKPRRR